MTACKSNLKNIATACEMYSTDAYAVDKVERYPLSLGALTPNYLKMIPRCPACQKDSYSESYLRAEGPASFTVYCQGGNHESAGVKGNYPQYNSTAGLILP